MAPGSSRATRVAMHLLASIGRHQLPSGGLFSVVLQPLYCSSCAVQSQRHWFSAEWLALGRSFPCRILSLAKCLFPNASSCCRPPSITILHVRATLQALHYQLDHHALVTWFRLHCSSVDCFAESLC